MLHPVASLVFASALVPATFAQKTAKPATAAPPTSTTLAEEREDRSWQPYAFHEETPGVWTAHCPYQELDFAVTSSEIAIANTAAASPPFTVIARCTGFGRASTMARLAPPAITKTKNRLDLDFGAGFSEWLVNDVRGLEQGWTIATRPSGDPTETIALALEFAGGLRFALDADACGGVFLDGADEVRLKYRDLAVIDAAGAKLAACLVVQANGSLLLEFDDAHASYPVTVDPYFFGPVWSIQGNQSNQELGAALAGVGDVDGDGFTDLLVASPGFTNPEVREGAVFLYRGSATGLASAPAWTVESNQPGAELGLAVAGAGDVNGDGFADVLVAAPNFTGAARIAGRVYAYYGSPNGLSTAPDWVVDGPSFCLMLGASVAGAGDVDGDGYDDVIVGATGGPIGTGSALLFRGSANGLAASPVWSVFGSQNGENLGAAVASAGDLDGDGCDDLIVGAPRHDGVGVPDVGAVHVFLGRPSGPSTSPDWSYFGTLANEQLGAAVASAGDVDADGFDEILVGAPHFALDRGRALLFEGSSSGLAPAPAWSVEGQPTTGRFGAAFGAPGDANQNGYADALVGAPGAGGGTVFSYDGSPNGLSTTPDWSEAGYALFGAALAFVGDTDHQGFPEIAVGGPWYSSSGHNQNGRAVVFSGTLAPLRLVTPSWAVHGGQREASYGFSVSDAGDVDGDGFDDVIVGAPEFDGGESAEGKADVYPGSVAGLATSPAWTVEGGLSLAKLGTSVSTAGDVDGDGFDDVIVGAPYFDDGQTNRGRAFVYLGSPNGLSTTPAWTADGGQALANEFGFSVSTAGDVDGDGFDDVIVGAPRYFNGVGSSFGRVFVYRGSPNGLSSAPAWTVSGPLLVNSFGYVVSTAGDVDGDGFDDVAVGSIDPQGKAFVFLGSPMGLSSTPAWSVQGQALANFGSVISTAGDVDGDGFDDVIVGAAYFDDGETDEGAAFVYLGSPSGLSTSPAWTVQGDRVDAHFGSSVSTAGDVDGDGFDDVIVGATGVEVLQFNEGASFVFLGSPMGLSAAAATAASQQSNSLFGWSVSTAGDVDGDGLDDVIVGAPDYSTVYYEGAVFGFF